MHVLLEGHPRSVGRLGIGREWSERRERPTPRVALLSCCDAHAPGGEVLGRLPGHVLTIRSAGATLGEDVLGCLEYACTVEGTSVIVVLGHSDCHAVRAACDRVEIGHLTGVLSRMGPAIRAVEARGIEDVPWQTFIERVAMEHATREAHAIPTRSPVLARLVREGSLKIVSAVADSETGTLHVQGAEGAAALQAAPVMVLA